MPGRVFVVVVSWLNVSIASRHIALAHYRHLENNVDLDFKQEATNPDKTLDNIFSSLFCGQLHTLYCMLTMRTTLSIILNGLLGVLMLLSLNISENYDDVGMDLK